MIAAVHEQVTRPTLKQTQPHVAMSYQKERKAVCAIAKKLGLKVRLSSQKLIGLQHTNGIFFI